jgi:hypothetical protein
MRLVSLGCALWLAATLSPTAARAETDARAAIWVQPVGTLVYATASAFSGGELLAIYVPLGANLRVNDQLELSLEASFYLRRSQCAPGAACMFRFGPRLAWTSGGLLSFGPVFRPWRQGMSGFFLQPKMAVSSFAGEVGGRDVDLQIGLDVGYSWRVGRFFIAPVLGGSVGYGFNVADAVSTPLWYEETGARSNRPTYGINLNLLRVGAVL